MAEGFSRPKAGPSHSPPSSSQSTDDALRLHNLIDRTCGKINELKQVMVEECRLTRQEYSDELMEPVLARQDAIIKRAMNCMQDQQKVLTGSVDLGGGPRRQMFGASLIDLSKVPAKGPERRENRPGSSRDAGIIKDFKERLIDRIKLSEAASEFRKITRQTEAAMAVMRNDEIEFEKKITAGFDQVEPEPKEKKGLSKLGKGKKWATETDIKWDKGRNKVTPVNFGVPEEEMMLEQERTRFEELSPDVDNSAWYGSLDRNVARKKKRVGGLDKNRRHTKTVGSIAGLNIGERYEKLRPDEHYEIGLPSIAVQQPSHTVGLAKNRPPIPTPTFSGYLENQHRPSFMTESDAPPMTPKEYRSRESPVDSPYIPHKSFLSHHKHRKISPLGLESPDWYGNSPAPQTSKSWFETNLDERKLSSPMSPNLVEPSTHMSMTGMDAVTENLNRTYIASPGTDISEKSSRSSDSDTRVNFANESSKPFEMADYYKYSTKFRTSTSSVQPRDTSFSSNSISDLSQLSTGSAVVNQDFTSPRNTGQSLSVGDINLTQKGRHVKTNANSLKFSVEGSSNNPEDRNGNYYDNDIQVPKLPPKQSSFSGRQPLSARSARPLDVMDGGDMRWFLDFDPPTFV